MYKFFDYDYYDTELSFIIISPWLYSLYNFIKNNEEHQAENLINQYNTKLDQDYENEFHEYLKEMVIYNATLKDPPIKQPYLTYEDLCIIIHQN